jgi:hypothetical protein
VCLSRTASRIAAQFAVARDLLSMVSDSFAAGSRNSFASVDNWRDVIALSQFPCALSFVTSWRGISEVWSEELCPDSVLEALEE